MTLTFRNKSLVSALGLLIWSSLAFAEKPMVTPMLKEAYNFMNKHDYGMAVRQFTKILTLDPGNPKAKEGLQSINNYIDAQNSKEEVLSPLERNQILDTAYKSLKRTSPETMDKYIREAEQNERKGYNLLASRIYQETLTFPGLELEKKHDLERRLRKTSAKVDAKIITLPANHQALYREAFTLMSVGDQENSIIKWRQYYNVAKSDYELQKLLTLPESVKILKEKKAVLNAQKALKNNRLKLAYIIYKNVLASNPKNQEALQGINNIKEIHKQRKKTQIIAARIENAKKLSQSGEKFKALNLLLKTVRYDPNNRDIYLLIGQLQSSISDKNNKVSKSLERALQQQFQEKKPIVQEKQDDKSNVAVDVAKAENHYQRGLVYYGLRNFRGALSEWELAVKYDPKYEKARKALQRVRSDLRAEE